MVQDESALSVAYMCLDTPAEALIMKKELWSAAQLNYIASHREGGRFYNLNIIERLLPQGYVAIVEHSGLEEPSVKPHCTYYRRGADGAYRRSWYYLMPELDEKLFHYFLYTTGDLGYGGSNDKDGFQQYWVTKGFFLERLPELERFFRPKCYTWRGNRRLKLDKEFQPLDEIFVWHKAAITNQYSVGDSGFSHMYLADDMSEAIITDNRRHLLYQKPLRGLTYQQMKDAFRNCFAGVHQDTYWDLAIPWYDGTLIGCFESYNLMHVTTVVNQLLDTIEYCPGISVLGCGLKTYAPEK